MEIYWVNQQMYDGILGGTQHWHLFYSLGQFDGVMLAELFDLACNNKDVFYSVISKTPGIDVVGIVRLSIAVKKLAADE